MSLTVSVRSISEGLVMGRLVVESEITPADDRVFDPTIEDDRWVSAHRQAMEDIRREIESADGDQAEILEAYELMMVDPEFTDIVNGLISECHSAEYAVYMAGVRLAEMLNSISDDYLRQRATDAKDISRRVLKLFSGSGSARQSYDGEILLVDELLASDVVDLKNSGVLAVVSKRGGTASHAAILARTHALPYVMLKSEGFDKYNGMTVIVDAYVGEIVVDPSINEQVDFVREAKNIKAEKEALMKYRDVQTHSADGKRRIVSVNISGPDDVQWAKKYGAEGIALFRTEFLFSETKEPSEEWQYEIYRRVLAEMDGVVTFRTLDIGGDKPSHIFHIENEDNPFLGVRGIRLMKIYPEVLKRQLRAIAKAAVDTERVSKIMFPMVTLRSDMEFAIQIYEEALRDLVQRYGDKYYQAKGLIILGMMVEVPSVAMNIDEFSDLVDFISIGTNDLCQYAMAADRTNPGVQDYYVTSDPGFLKMIAYCVKTAISEGLHVSMCGNLAFHSELIELWNYLGIEEYGVVATNILATKKALTELDSRKSPRNLRFVI